MGFFVKVWILGYRGLLWGRWAEWARKRNQMLLGHGSLRGGIWRRGWKMYLWSMRRFWIVPLNQMLEIWIELIKRSRQYQLYQVSILISWELTLLRVIPKFIKWGFWKKLIYILKAIILIKVWILCMRDSMLLMFMNIFNLLISKLGKIWVRFKMVNFRLYQNLKRRWKKDFRNLKVNILSVLSLFKKFMKKVKNIKTIILIKKLYMLRNLMI